MHVSKPIRVTVVAILVAGVALLAWQQRTIATLREETAALRKENQGLLQLRNQALPAGRTSEKQ